LESLLAILKGYWKATEKYQNTHCQTTGEEVELPRGFWQKRGNFHPFSLKCCVSVYILLKVKEAVENFKNS
jgi:hypothetical protein